MIKRTLFSTIFTLISFVIILALIAITIVSSFALRVFFNDLSAYELKQSALIVAASIENISDKQKELSSYIQKITSETDMRISIISSSGTVLADSETDASKLESHLFREEIRKANETGYGYSSRFSESLKTDMAYVAVKIKSSSNANDFYFVRTALAIPLIKSQLSLFNYQMIFACIVLIFLGAIASIMIANLVRKPIDELKKASSAWAKGNLQTKAFIRSNTSRIFFLKTPKELVLLADTMNLMAEDLKKRITEISRNKEEQEAILQSITEAVIVTDREGKISSVNKFTSVIFNTGTSEKTIGIKLLELVRNTDITALEELARKGETVEEKITLYDTERKNLLVHASHLKKSGGAVLVISDVTKLLKLETIRKDFVANVSHELKTPIQAIKGFIETLLDDGFENQESSLKFLTIIKNNTERLNSIINDLLTLANIEKEEENITIQFSNTFISPILERVFVLTQEKALKREMNILINCNEKTQAFINENLVEQAIINLVDNSIKYAKPKTDITITVEEKLLNNENANTENTNTKNTKSVIEIKVKDEGSGIPVSEQKRIFERFYCIDKSRSRISGGTGLGLSIVAHIMKIHSGKVEVESKNQEGSTFTLTFPKE